MVGGTNITYIDIYVDDTFAAGVYVANETYGTNPIHGVTNVKFRGRNTVRRANRNTDPAGVASPVDHGAVLVSSQRDGVTNSDILFEGFEIYDTRPAAPWEVGVIAHDGTNSNVTFRNFRFHNRIGNTWYIGANATDGGVNTGVNRYTPWEKYSNTAATLA